MLPISTHKQHEVIQAVEPRVRLPSRIRSENEMVGLLKDDLLLPPTPDKQDWREDRPKGTKVATVHFEQGPSWDNYSQTLHQLLDAMEAYTCEDWKGIINRIGRTFQQAGYPFDE